MFEEETGIKMDPSDLALVGVYSKPGRDPRGWTVSAAYLAKVDPKKVKPVAADDASDAKWFLISEGPRLTCGEISLGLPDLAFDHEDIVGDAINQSDF